MRVAAAADLAFDGDDGITGAEAAALAPSLLPFTSAAPQLASPTPEPAWLDKAMTDARGLLNQAQEAGQTFAPADTSWVTTAMMHALDKYQTMMTERTDALDDEDDARAPSE